MPLQASDPYGPEFPPSEYAARYRRLQERMQAQGVDALLASAKLHLRYLAGYRSPFWDMVADIQLAILPATSDREPILILPSSHEFTAGTSWIQRVEYVIPERPAPHDDACNLAAALLQDMGLGQAALGLDIDVGPLENMPPIAFDRIRAQLPGATVVNAYPLILELRSVKSPAELDAVRAATRATAKAFEAAFRQIRGGMSKRQFGEILCRTMMEQVGESCHMRQWIVFLGAGRDMATWCNFATSEYRFEMGDLIVADGGCSYKGYCADMMRWGAIGEASREQTYMLQVMTEAMEAGKATLHAGVTCGEVEAAMRHVISNSRVDQEAWQIAGLAGHGIGLEIHELPRLTPGSDTVLRPGMTLSVEPLILKQVGGRFTRTSGTWASGAPPDMFVMEDNVAITEGGYELLSPVATSIWRGD